MVAVEIICNPYLRLKHQMGRNVTAKRQGVSDAFAIEDGEGELVEHALLVSIDAAVVVVGVEISRHERRP